jgi:hypothetical protein
VLLVYCELPLPVVAPLAELLLPCDVPSELLVPLGVVLSGAELLPLGLRVPDGLELGVLGAVLPLNESTAKSIRPEVGLINTSRTVPNVCPDELVTCAPVNWLARMVFGARPSGLVIWLPGELEEAPD